MSGAALQPQPVHGCRLTRNLRVISPLYHSLGDLQTEFKNLMAIFSLN